MKKWLVLISTYFDEKHLGHDRMSHIFMVVISKNLWSNQKSLSLLKNRSLPDYSFLGSVPFKIILINYRHYDSLRKDVSLQNRPLRKKSWLRTLVTFFSSHFQSWSFLKRGSLHSLRVIFFFRNSTDTYFSILKFHKIEYKLCRLRSVSLYIFLLFSRKM